MTECGADVAAYALGSLDAAERRSFERHLATCAVCPDELVVFELVVGGLAEGVPRRRVPPDLRRRLLAEVALDAPAPTGAATPRFLRARRQRTGAGARGPVVALCALLIAVASVAGILRLASSSGPVSRVVQARVIGGAGSAQLRRASGHAELIVHDMSPPPSGEIYEVWLNRDGHPAQPTSALFNVTDSGDADVDVPGDLRHIDQIMVTPEPAGGTQTPTHPAVITAQLT